MDSNLTRRRILTSGGVAAGVAASLALTEGSAQAAEDGAGRTSRRRMLAVSAEHVRAETVLRSVEATMATVAANPVWEFEPLGYRVTGRAAVAEMYRRLIDNFFPLFLGGTNRGTWFSDNGIVSEDEVVVRLPAGGQLTTPVASVLVFDGDLIVSERVYLGHGLKDLVVDALGPRFWEIPGVTVA